MDEIERESISLEPFNFTIFDFIRPANVKSIPSNFKSISLNLNCKIPEAISKLSNITNLLFTNYKNYFEKSGSYNSKPVFIKGTARCSKYTTVDIEVYCDEDIILNRMISALE